MRPHWVLLAITCLASCGARSTQMDKPQLIELMNSLATEQLELRAIECVDDAFQGRADTFCYAAPYDADEFGQRVDRLKGFRSVTGWRDDYGVLSAALQYGDVPREIGVNFERPNRFWALDGYEALREAQGQVVIVVTDDNPAARQ